MTMRSLICEECGSSFEFRPNGKPAKRCSDECRRAHSAKRARVARASGAWIDRRPNRGPWSGAKTCRYCGDDFEARSPKSEVCYAQKCQSRRNADRCRPFTAERRARKRDAVSERFDPRDVFARDGWICGLCGESVDPALTWPAPKSASLDHVVPLSRGGDHTLANTQLAHLTCNTAKGARVDT